MSQDAPLRSFTATDLRRAWNDFFLARGHTSVPSASLIPTHPSAPMFTNSGMMPFVSYFLGEEPVPFDPPRAVSVQKCVRAGGKHNDLDAIGRSPRHLSFFEMLGNFSFGDYFKDEAIPWAWEFVTEVLGIDGERLWVTCHVSDDEAEDIWADGVGVPRSRIQRLDKDNFWEMGETGPCGPSSEIFFDFGPDLGPEGGPANELAEDRFVEIWNLVFTQYFRGPDGQLTDLPSRNVDTGAGLERILAVLSGSHSLYAADVLADLVDEAQSVTGTRLGASSLGDIALRLLADHTRTAAFLVSDGVVPSNEDRGYVLRRIIRRAVRFAYMLDVDRLVLPPMVERCVGIMGEAYPDLAANAPAVVEMIGREEDRFRSTLARGSVLLDTALDTVGDTATLDGRVAFELHDTFGFPLEVTQEMADLRGVEVDVAGFDTAMSEQRQRSRAAGRRSGGRGSPPPARVSLRVRRPSRSARCWPSTARPSSPGARRPRPQQRCSPSSAMPCTSTGRRSTRSPGDRWATRERSRRRPVRSRWPTRPMPSRDFTATTSVRSTAASTRGSPPPLPSTRVDVRRSGGTTQRPTSCTGRCARCSAIT
jgi:alanyl-tRNA synthetase